jgi:hypothetical protein
VVSLTPHGRGMWLRAGLYPVERRLFLLGNPGPPVLIGLICVEVIVLFSLGYEKGREASAGPWEGSDGSAEDVGCASQLFVPL